MEATGISFTEFAYSLLQAYDFLHLNEKHGCLLQAAARTSGATSSAGIDLIRRKHDVTACGLTTPLLTKTDGTKFGKTEGGAVWLSPERPAFTASTNSSSRSRTRRSSSSSNSSRSSRRKRSPPSKRSTPPRRRTPRRASKLALELTTLVHGETATKDAIRASEILFGGSLDGITEKQFDEVIAEVPNVTLSKEILGQPAGALIDVLVASQLCPSKGQARKDIEANGINVNNVRVTDIKLTLTAEQPPLRQVRPPAQRQTQLRAGEVRVREGQPRLARQHQ
jgi:tyrosyl-tRNA synthetase